jgi:hypothetical protein
MHGMGITAETLGARGNLLAQGGCVDVGANSTFLPPYRPILTCESPLVQVSMTRVVSMCVFSPFPLSPSPHFISLMRERILSYLEHVTRNSFIVTASTPVLGQCMKPPCI